MSNDLIHEVEEAVRQEKLESFWKEYGSYIITAAVLTVLFTALFSGWNSWQEKTNKTQTAIVLNALDSGDVTTSLTQSAAGLRPGHKVVAHMITAGKFIEEGDKEQALISYQAISSDSSIEPIFRDLASLIEAKLAWEIAAEKNDGKEAAAKNILAKLNALTGNAKSPWYHHAHLQAAIIKAHGFGNYKEAVDHLAVVMTGQGLPQSLMQRAQSLSHIYSIKLMRNKADNAAGEENATEEAEG